ncbi:MAG TPA: UPF0175 family protein [Bacteroidales bacterium]|nr:UPF0175 family protein [Bacteroidales bacterium]
MSHQISISFPEDLANSLKLKTEEFESEIKIISLVKLYELGKISSGYAAEILNMERTDFLQLLHKYQVSYFNESSVDEIENDYKNA